MGDIGDEIFIIQQPDPDTNCVEQGGDKSGRIICGELKCNREEASVHILCA